MMWAVIAACIAVVSLGTWALAIEHSECAARGGNMVHVGTYVYIWQVTDYKTGMGFMNMVPNMACTVPAK